jgi:DNA-binding NtrC family response regulator
MTTPNILLVDDEVPFVETMIKRLDKRGISAMSASSGDEALIQLEHHPGLEAIVLDVKMPGLDGIETLKEIKKRYPLTEVIMLTGHATVETAIEGMKLGAFDYLMKPCELDALIVKVREAVKKKHDHDLKIQQASINKLMLTRGF